MALLTNGAVLVAKSQETLRTSASILSHERERILADGLGVEGSIDHASLAAVNIVGVLCARRKVKGKKKEARKGEA